MYNEEVYFNEDFARSIQVQERIMVWTQKVIIHGETKIGNKMTVVQIGGEGCDKIAICLLMSVKREKSKELILKFIALKISLLLSLTKWKDQARC